MLSTNLEFKKLLLLHGKDRRKQSMELELANSPKLISMLDSKINIEKETIESAKSELSKFETKNSFLENEFNSISDQISNLKNKQLQVKKNDEYQALENEISNLFAKQAQLEDEQIEILVKIDDARETVKIAEDKITAKVIHLEKDKTQLKQRVEELKTDIAKLISEINEAENDVENSLLIGYKQTKKIVSRPPYIAPLDEQKCSGCNLRVSNDVVSSVLVEQKLTHCDQCGRIVYCQR